jgi:hypothetical protein
LNDHCACTDNCIPANVRHHYRSAANPDARANPDKSRCSGLFPNRHYQIRVTMSPGPAGYMDPCRQKDIRLNVRQSNVTARANIYILLNPRPGL